MKNNQLRTILKFSISRFLKEYNCLRTQKKLFKKKKATNPKHFKSNFGTLTSCIVSVTSQFWARLHTSIKYSLFTIIKNLTGYVPFLEMKRKTLVSKTKELTKKEKDAIIKKKYKELTRTFLGGKENNEVNKRHFSMF